MNKQQKQETKLILEQPVLAVENYILVSAQKAAKKAMKMFSSDMKKYPELKKAFDKINKNLENWKAKETAKTKKNINAMTKLLKNKS